MILKKAYVFNKDGEDDDDEDKDIRATEQGEGREEGDIGDL